MNIKENVIQTATDIKMGYLTAGMTATTGAGTILDYIPDDIGKLTTVVGVVLSIAIFYFQFQKHRRDKTIHKLDCLLKEQEIELNKGKLN